MKTVVFALLIATISAACASRQTTVASSSTEAVEPEARTPEQVRAAGEGLLEQYRQALSVRSFDALAELYPHSLDVVVIRQGKVAAGWTAVQSHLKDLLARAAEIHITFSDVAVTALDDGAATVVASMRLEVSDGTAAVVEQGVLTLCARRAGDRWVIVTEHFSYPPGAAGGVEASAVPR